MCTTITSKLLLPIPFVLGYVRIYYNPLPIQAVLSTLDRRLSSLSLKICNDGDPIYHHLRQTIPLLDSLYPQEVLCDVN